MNKTDCNATLDWVDEDQNSWVSQDTTPDQRSIEEYLKDTRGEKILHVGIGNGTFPDKVKGNEVYGIAVHKSEVDNTRAKGYKSKKRFNKYTTDLTKYYRGLDIIVDNNPKSYACHVDCFKDYISNARDLLKDGGRFITHKQGLEFISFASSVAPGSVDELVEIFKPSKVIEKNQLVVLIK